MFSLHETSLSTAEVSMAAQTTIASASPKCSITPTVLLTLNTANDII